MNKFFYIITLAALAFSAGALTPQDAVKKITWYGQNSLRLELAGKLIWIDPVNIPISEKADLILITHSHQDHYCSSDIKKLSGPATAVYLAFDSPDGKRIRPGDSLSLGGLKVEAVPAYNIVKTNFHPKASGFCGFILSGQGVRIYDSGDTERIPEMKSVKADIALLPLGQTYTMNSVDEAVQAALDTGASIAIPVHFGMYEGTQADADKFISDLKKKGINAVQLPRVK